VFPEKTRNSPEVKESSVSFLMFLYSTLFRYFPEIQSKPQLFRKIPRYINEFSGTIITFFTVHGTVYTEKSCFYTSILSESNNGLNNKADVQQ
jgi:hypothetical protein